MRAASTRANHEIHGSAGPKVKAQDSVIAEPVEYQDADSRGASLVPFGHPVNFYNRPKALARRLGHTRLRSCVIPEHTAVLKEYLKDSKCNPVAVFTWPPTGKDISISRVRFLR